MSVTSTPKDTTQSSILLVSDPFEQQRREEGTAQGPVGPRAWRWEEHGGEGGFGNRWLRVSEGA